MALLTVSSDIRRALETCPTVAVLGAHDDPWRAAWYVPDYLRRHGYRVLPVNPMKRGASLWGEPVRATLTEITREVGRVDLVDVFRRSEDLPAHLDDVLAMTPLPRVVWLQLGIRHAGFTRALVAHGIDVVEDRCTLQDHKLFALGAPRDGGA
ncbi:MAG: CoA-binding protein [Deltaproteobacteria bacterium]|nr:CoA-binding protein [Deltaproteobacteria bacterium]